MVRACRYNSPIVAEQAAAFLRANGVPATVVGHHVNDVFAISAFRSVSLDLVVPRRNLLPAAERLLKEFHAQPSVPEGDWEAMARPDLSRLDPLLRVRCPACDGEVDPRPAPDQCPSCRGEIDVVELIVRQHGPEVLSQCYDAAPEQPAIAAAFDAACANCGCVLGGAEPRGRCPDCGTLYDKHEMFGRRM